MELSSSGISSASSMVQVRALSTTRDAELSSAVQLPVKEEELLKAELGPLLCKCPSLSLSFAPAMCDDP